MNTATRYSKFANTTVMNSVRRVLIDEIPVWTFDDIHFINFNSSVYNMEYIIQRLQLIPLIQSAVNNKNQDITFTCKVKNTTSDWLTVTPNDIKSSDDKLLSMNKLIKSRILNDLPIIKLPPNESINFTAKLKQGVGNGYTKFCHAWYDDDYFYVESIDKCLDTTAALKKAFDVLINYCGTIKKKVSKQKNSESNENTLKIELGFKDVSRSALNVIVKKLRELIRYSIAYIKHMNAGNMSSLSAEQIYELVKPNDYIVSLVQPHMSENFFKVLIDINMDYVKVSGDVDVNKKYIQDIFPSIVRSTNLSIDQSENKYMHFCIYMFTMAINVVMNELTLLKKSIQEE